LRRKVRLILLLISLLFIISSCKNKTEKDSIEKIKDDYEILKEKLENAETENKSLKVQLNDLIQKTNLNHTSSNTEYEIQYAIKKSEILGGFDEIILCQNYIQENGIISIINSYNNIFNPQQVKANDMIDGYKVKEVKISDDGQEEVSFEGSCILTGELIINEVGGSYFSLLCDNTEISRSIPISTSWIDMNIFYDRAHVFFHLANDDKVIEEIGVDRKNKMLEYQDGGSTITYKITATFKNFYYAFKPNTDLGSRIELVEILAIEELNQ